MIISSLGSGGGEAAAAAPSNDVVVGRTTRELEEVVDVYQVVRAGWMTRMHRLETFGARYIAYRLENYIDEPEFAELVREIVEKVQKEDGEQPRRVNIVYKPMPTDDPQKRRPDITRAKVYLNWEPRVRSLLT